ncbi:MAG: lipopolysaccharide biosynthesis protein [Gammaproteobacteria bacterium]|nr:lipopolysaccharide biosynthesis protein [Gammaproteobacteria bacterium]
MVDRVGILSLISRLKQSQFVRRVMTVFTGSVFAQLMPLLAAPALTRLYSPDDFGIFALYYSVITISGVLATGRYEMAITLPKDEQDAAAVFLLSILSSVFFCLLLVVGTGIWQSSLNGYLGAEENSSLIFWIPLGALGIASFRVFSYWAIYRARFRGLAIGKVVQAGGIAGLQLSAGGISLAGGLVAGQVAGHLLGALYLFIRTVSADLYLLKQVARDRLLSVARGYYKFPLLSLPASLANTLTSQLPVIMLSLYFGPTVVGLFALTQRALGAPIALLGVSVQEVFREQASRDFRQTGSCRDIYMKTFKALTALALLPFLLLFIFAPLLFEFVFGSEWRAAGDYTRLLITLFFLRFIASPLSYVLYIAEKQLHDLVWQIGLLLITGVSLVAGGLLNDPTLSIAFYAGSYSVMYLIYLVMSYRYSERREDDCRRRL